MSVKLGVMIIIFLIGIGVLISGCVNSGSSSDNKGNTGTTSTVNTIHVDGSAPMYPVINVIASDYMGSHAGNKVVMGNCGTSGMGIAMLLNGTIDICDSTRAPNSKEQDTAQANGVTFHLTQVCSDGICVLVNPSCPVSDLNMSQLNDIFFTGNITNWSQLTNGAKSGPIHVYAVNGTNSGVSSNFNQIVTKNSSAKYANGYSEKDSQNQVVSVITGDPDGISFTSLSYVNSEVKAVKVNGVAPSEATVKSTAYPISIKLYMITNGDPTGLAKDFITYVLSTDGQNIVTRMGMISYM